MRELNMQEVEYVSGGDHGGYWHNDDLTPTVARNAGFGALGGSLAGPTGALAGGAIGALRGFSVYYNNN